MNSMNHEAFKSLYNQGMDAYDQQDYEQAKRLLIKAAEVANEIAKNAISSSVKTEYISIAKKIIDFVNTKCKKKKVSDKKNDDDTIDVNKMKVDKANTITFKDVAGLEEVKDQIKFKVINPLKNPDLAKQYKINAGGKILLYGPPGVGKTFIARAIAGEVDAAFYAVNCQDLISKYLGESSKQLTKLFEEALENERAIIFFDEFDSMAAKRESDNGGVDAEISRFVSSFLTNVDGFKKSKTNKMLLLIAATNRPWALDNAMMRGGRFDTQIYVGLPDAKARKFMVEKAFDQVPLDPNLNIDEVVTLLDGYGGGDVVAICEKIRLAVYKKAVKNNKTELITFDDCKQVIENHRNVITDSEIDRFIRYSMGEE